MSLGKISIKPWNYQLRMHANPKKALKFKLYEPLKILIILNCWAFHFFPFYNIFHIKDFSFCANISFEIYYLSSMVNGESSNLMHEFSSEKHAYLSNENWNIEPIKMYSIAYEKELKYHRNEFLCWARMQFDAISWDGCFIINNKKLRTRKGAIPTSTILLLLAIWSHKRKAFKFILFPINRASSLKPPLHCKNDIKNIYFCFSTETSFFNQQN